MRRISIDNEPAWLMKEVSVLTFLMRKSAKLTRIRHYFQFVESSKYIQSSFIIIFAAGKFATSSTFSKKPNHEARKTLLANAFFVLQLWQRLLLEKSSKLSSHVFSKILAKETKWWNCCKKKVLPFTQIFFLLIAKSVVAKIEEEYCADSFKTNDFPQKLSLSLSHMKLQWSCFPTLDFNIFSRNFSR